MSGEFDFLAKYEGEAFKIGVVKALEALHGMHMRLQESLDKRQEESSEALKNFQEAVEVVKAQIADVDEKWRIVYNKVMNDESTH